MSKDQFKTRLQIAKNKLLRKNLEGKNQNTSNIGSAFKLSTELVAAVVVGSTMGFLLDNWFGTKPMLTICFFFMGVAAGILNVFKSAKKCTKILKNN